MNTLALELGVFAALFLGLAVSLEIGFLFGRRSARSKSPARGADVGATQGAVLGLLGLLLGFSFAGAASRYIERQDLILQEANAIGTAYLRADLVDDPFASSIRKTLADYVQHRLEVSKRLSNEVLADAAPRVAALHAQLWQAARDGVLAKPAVTVAVLNPVNEVIDLQ